MNIEIFEEIKNDDIKAVERHLKPLPASYLEKTDEDGCTPLHIASGNGKVKIVELLLTKNPSLASRDKNGSTPLHKAVDFMCLDIDYDVVTALLEVIKTMEEGEKSAILNAYDHDGKTALHYAAFLPMEKFVRAILEAGADANIRDTSNGDLPARIAALVSQWETAATLYKKSTIKLRPEYIDGPAVFTCFHYAISCNDWPVVSRTVNRIADGHIFGFENNLSTLLLASETPFPSPERSNQIFSEKGKVFERKKAGDSTMSEIKSLLERIANVTSSMPPEPLLKTAIHSLAEEEKEKSSSDSPRQDGLAHETPGNGVNAAHLQHAQAVDQTGDPGPSQSRIPGSSQTGSKSGNKETLKNVVYTFPFNNVLGTLAFIEDFRREDGPLNDSKLRREGAPLEGSGEFLTRQFYGDILRQRVFPKVRFEKEPAYFLRLREPTYVSISDGGLFIRSLVIPCFSYQTWEQFQLWRAPGTAGREPPFKRNSAFESLGINFPLSLDEYCSPMLSEQSLNERNRDQVILKVQRKEAQKDPRKSPNENQQMRQKPNIQVPKDARILVVTQMWLWELEDVLIMSPFTNPPSNRNAVIGKGKSPAKSSKFIPTRIVGEPGYNNDTVNHLCVPNLFPFMRDATKSNDRMRAIGLIISDLVNLLEDPIPDSPEDPILSIYEEYIASVGEEADLYSRGLGLATINLEKERLYLHDINDARVELAMIKRVIVQQETVWKEFVRDVWPDYWDAERMHVPADDRHNMNSREREEWAKIVRPQAQFESYRRRIEQLDEDAERVERLILAKLDLKQKHTSLREAHATGIMSAAVLGFTIITIIFTPLSFVTSLFALSIDQFQKQQVDWYVPGPRDDTSAVNMTRVYTKSYIGKWAAVAEISSTLVALIAMALAIAFGIGEPILAGKVWERIRKPFGKRNEDAVADQPHHNVDNPKSGSVGCLSAKAILGKLRNRKAGRNQDKGKEANDIEGGFSDRAQ